MADDTRNQHNRSQPQRSGGWHSSERQNDAQPAQGSHGHPAVDTAEDLDDMPAGGRSRSNRERAAIADDHGLGDRERRSFSGDRESDELGSETEDDAGIDRMDDDDDFGGSRSDR